MNELFEKSLQSLVKDELAIAALKSHFYSTLEQLRPIADDVQKLSNEIIGAQTRAFVTTQSVLDACFANLANYQVSDTSTSDEDSGV